MPQSVPPSTNPRRGNPRVGLVQLPAEGRQGPPPPWPASGRQTRAQAEAWAALWRTPQAVAWERLGYTREVARYCRLLVASEQPAATAAIHAQATALADRLGLTPKAMRMLLWTVVDDQVAEQRAGRDHGEEQRAPGARARLRAVE